MYLSIYLPIHPSINQSIYLSVYLSDTSVMTVKLAIGTGNVKLDGMCLGRASGHSSSSQSAPLELTGQGREVLSRSPEPLSEWAR